MHAENMLTQALETLSRAERDGTTVDQKVLDSLLGGRRERKLECRRIERKIESDMRKEAAGQPKIDDSSFGQY